MAGKRQPVELVMAKGNKHLTKAEIEQRQKTEVKAPVPEGAVPPVWLPESLQEDFREIGRELIELGIYSDMDRDTLGRYLVTSRQWVAASIQAQAALDAEDAEAAARWTGIQDKFFKQARACANDLGLTISSRCRLVLPNQGKEDENPFEKMLLERMNRNGV